MTSFYYITPFNPWAWQLFLSSYIFFKFFLKALKFSSHKIFNCFIGVTSRNLILFMAICEGCYFPFFLHSQCVCCMLEGYWVFELIFYPATSLKLFIKCNSITVDFFGVSYSYYHIFCKWGYFDFFLYNLYLIDVFNSLIAVARTSRTIL